MRASWPLHASHRWRLTPFVAPFVATLALFVPAGASGSMAPAGRDGCADCHADVARMNPYGLPTDQLAQYRTSGHGKALFGQHDTSVAVCSICHGAHGILGPGSSESPVHPTHVPATCGQCHADAARMGSHGLDPGVGAAYQGSIHAEMLLQKGDVSAPQCATCHGSHGAIPPGFRSVAAVCGRCHARERELFETSPHAPLVRSGDFPGCQVCHGDHAVRLAELAILERVCALCHGGSPQTLAKRDRLHAGSPRRTRRWPRRRRSGAPRRSAASRPTTISSSWTRPGRR